MLADARMVGTRTATGQAALSEGQGHVDKATVARQPGFQTTPRNTRIQDGPFAIQFLAVLPVPNSSQRRESFMQRNSHVNASPPPLP
jgi:hypothetical protein